MVGCGQAGASPGAYKPPVARSSAPKLPPGAAEPPAASPSKSARKRQNRKNKQNAQGSEPAEADQAAQNEQKDTRELTKEAKTQHEQPGKQAVPSTCTDAKESAPHGKEVWFCVSSCQAEVAI